ncbi:hypothetical protein SAMN05216167_105149 [Spirosoma endophyticum]|uniref:Uncharacterized protein n=2 Tax=Spirosoma endophyticum TaxID=662367 RepID=A0A1I1SLC9_9BACT|nr:hypothetical protein SAMN05216167_105149 [Spirosoma endophyticum]
MVVSHELGALAADVHTQDLFHNTPMFGMAGGVVSFANLDASSYEKPNPGGFRRLLIIKSKDIDGVWPKLADITAGEIVEAPEFVTGAKLAEYSFPDGSFDLTDASDGDPGFQSFKHAGTFMMAGFGKALTAEIMKHLNAGCILIGEMNDNQFAVAGTSDNPLYVKTAFSSGKKGAEKRGYTCKAEQDGFMFGVTPLKAEIAAQLPLIAAV